MGRYTTVQAFADNNPNMRAVDYAQATGTTASSSGSAAAAAPAAAAEKVDNPYGSTAGAGSGEFHVYRHARAREMERWKKINADEAEMKAEEEFQKKLASDTTSEAEKTEKRRRKRERAKEAKRRKKNLKLGGVGDGIVNEEEGEEEFEYAPIAASEISQGALKSDVGDTGKAEGSPQNDDESSPKEGSKKSAPEENSEIPFANDGSFLERMKKELANAE
ncbi:hypothetical protein ACHAXR_012475 [Thalassiosira sp. AJA248-18]